MRKSFILAFLFVLQAIPIRAHCPLCTIGAAAAAGGALWLGVSVGVVALFIGAFAVAVGWWVAKLIKRKLIFGQDWIIISISFLTTVLPILPFVKDTRPVFVSWVGEYGSLLNRTYLVSVPLVASIFGGLLVAVTPWMSAKITALRKGRMIRFQGILLTFLLLIVAGVLFEVVL